jgi:hypothetical protein
VGDFNGDGKLDLAVVNFASNTISILLGTGTGSFGAKTDFGTGSSPRSVAVGDFNGDGKLDLAVANTGDNTVSILLGTGMGSFASKTDFSTDGGPFSIAAGDFNRDGKLDVATANSSSNTISILTNNTPPNIILAAVTRTAGTSSANVLIATVSDPQDAANALTVTINGGASATVNGVSLTLNSTPPNAKGQVFANIVTGCTATTAIFTLDVTDSCGFLSEIGMTVTVTAPIPLRIDNVTPPAGRASGGQQITLRGAFANLSTLTIGGASASWFYTNGASDTSTVTATTPSHSVGAVQIELTPTCGSMYSRANAFAYLPTVFTDNTIMVGQTTAKAQHIIELRQAVDALRAVAGLGPAPWTDLTLSAFNTQIKAVHILELRSFLEDAAARLGYAAGSYNDPSLNTGFVIKRIHIEDLRQRIRNIAG